MNRGDDTSSALSTIEEVLKLSGAEAAEGKLVRLEGFIIYADPVKAEVLLKDRTGDIRVNVDLQKRPVQAGKWAILEGKTNAVLTRYPDFPSGKHYLPIFEGPTAAGSHYLARIRGYIHPPVTGEYTFWIASDNGGDLRLSTDDTAEHARRICEVADIFAWVGPRDWHRGLGQRSAKIFLRADQKYYIEARQWEEEGGDNLAVAWEGPNLPESVIGGEYLSPPDDTNVASGQSTTRGSILREYWLNYPFPDSLGSELLRLSRTNLEAVLKTPPTFFSRVGITENAITTVAGKSPPEAARVTLEQAWAREDDFSRVQVEGLVGQISNDGAYWTVLELTDNERKMVLRLPNPDRKSFKSLLNTRVTATGFCEGAANERGERVASILWLSSIGDFSLIKPSDNDWSRLPAIAIRELGSASSLSRLGQRIKILGRVLEVNSAQEIIVRDEVSKFTGYTSADGIKWEVSGEPVDVVMNHSVYIGIAAYSRTNLCKAEFDHLSLPLSGYGTTVGEAVLPGSSQRQGEKLVIVGTGSMGINGNGNALSDEFHYVANRLNGDGEIIARMIQLFPKDALFPGSEAGLMIRNTLDADSTFSFIGGSSNVGTYFNFRRGKGTPMESLPEGKDLPRWLKLVRRSAPPVTIHPAETVNLVSGQAIEIAGVMEQSNGRWHLTQAFVREAAVTDKTFLKPSGKDITSVLQMRQLAADELAQHHVAKIRGVVTAKNTELFVQDGTGGVRIPTRSWQKFADCEIGQYIEVIGRCVPGLYSPVLEPDERSDLRIINKGQMPKPLVLTHDQMTRGGGDAQWVEVKGVARSVEGRVMKIQMSGGDLYMDLGFDMTQENILSLIDSNVRVRGVCHVLANEKKQFAGVRLIVPAAEFIVVDEWPPSDPFSVQSESIGSVLLFDDRSEAIHRVKIAGVVTYARDGFYFIQDDNAGVEVATISQQPLKSGDQVEALGFPDSSGSSLILSDALIRQVGVAPLPEPLELAGNESPQAVHMAKRITLSAAYLGRSTISNNDIFQFQRAGRVFQGLLIKQEGALLQLEPGSTVRLTGVCNAVTNRERNSSSADPEFELLLSSMTNVTVLERPVWWNLRRMLWIGTIFLGGLSIAAIWIAMISRKNRLLRVTKSELQKSNDELESRVEHRTADLAAANEDLSREQALLRSLLDSSPDEIYFKDINSRYLKASRAQAENFGATSPEALIGKTDLDFFGTDTAGTSYKDEQEIIRKGQPMIGQIRKEVRKNGRILWMLSSKMPLRNKSDEIVGTFGISKDITAIKEAENKLAEVHKQLIKTSHQAGMAEVATSVLHNVGNVLNSVNVSSTIVTERVRDSRIINVARVSELLETHATDFASFVKNDPRGQKLPMYLRSLSETLIKEQKELLTELENLCKNVAHIKEIVTMQQSYAKVSGVTETLPLPELVEDAVRMNAGSFGRQGVALRREYIAQPTITVEKNKVIQILVNLLKNAKDACDQSERRDKLITAQIRVDAGRVKVAIIDNGIGIPPENLTRIFAHGFTTRKEGHGFGLHSGALAAMEMGGSLTAYSDGPGAGATFVLELPLGSQGRADDSELP